jgi:hypothetical protein
MFLVLSAATGCFWHRYPRLVVTHAELLADMAQKGRDLVVLGRFTAETLPELTYPLERARAFEQDALRRAGSPAPASLAPFSRLVRSYQGFVQTLDDLRRQPAADQARDQAALDAVVASIRADADAVKAAVAATP